MADLVCGATKKLGRIILIVVPRQLDHSSTEISLALSSHRDNHSLAVSANLAIQSVAAVSSRLSVHSMTVLHPIVFLLDADNTLLDNDAIQLDLKDHLERVFGRATRERYWRILEDLFAEVGYRDYIGALQRYRSEHPLEVELLSMSSFLMDYPFAERLFPAALEVLQRLRSLGPTVVLSDGDVVFQPRKIEHAGLADAVDGRVLIYIHKEEALDDVERRYPAEHYVLVDDKLRILAAVKAVWGERVTTVFARQGSYAQDSQGARRLPGGGRDDRAHRRLARLRLAGAADGRPLHLQPSPEGKAMKPTKALHDLGQSLWLDNITRELLNSGTLQRYIDELSVTGLTSNPTIFDQAIKNSSTYDADIARKAPSAKSGEDSVLRTRDCGSEPRRRPVSAGLRPDRRCRRLGVARGLAAAGA